MQFECLVVINLPIDEVVELWKDPNNLKHWQEGLVSYEPLEGTKGTVGAKSRYIYEQGKRRMEITETIQAMNLPHEMKGLYEHEHMDNTMLNRFEAISENQTKWTAEIDYFAMHGFVAKVMAQLFPGLFKKQTQKWLDRFKAFAESS